MTALEPTRVRMPLLRGWMRLAERVTDALLDPARRERTVGVLLVGFAALWFLFALLSRASCDVYFDIGEIMGWWRRPALAYHHPPMSVWIGGLWFALFPRMDFAAYLLAAVNAIATLWISWRLFSEWLDETKRVFALAMLTLSFVHTFHAMFFNANTVQSPFWAAATLFFLRSFITHDLRQSAYAGVAAAGALLGKYWSIFLVGAMAFAAILDRRRRDYFGSAAPWVSISVGLLVLAPHIIWVLAVDPVSLGFAGTTRTPPNAVNLRSLIYFPESVLYVIAPLLLFLTLRPSRTALRDILVPKDVNRRLVATLWAAALLLPPLVNLFAPFRLTSLWTIPNWTLFPIVLLSTPHIAITRTVLTRVVAIALAFPIVMVTIAPLVALATHEWHLGRSQPHHRALARAIEQLWAEASDKPVKLIGGDPESVSGTLFYLDQATALEGHLIDDASDRRDIAVGGPDGERLARDGLVVVCKAQDAYCQAAQERVAGTRAASRREVELVRVYLGIPGTPDRYVLLALPPTR